MKRFALLFLFLCARAGLGAPPIVVERPAALPQWGGELRFCLQADPKTFDPVRVADGPGETVRYLTGGVLIRMNRLTQQFEPELAESWKILEGGRSLDFKLRDGIRFSDGSPFTAEAVAFTMRTLIDPNVHSPTGDSFRTAAGLPSVTVHSANRVTIRFPAPIAGVERLFDQVAIVSSRSLEIASQPERMPVLGPFRVAEYKPGVFLLLTRNPYYWKSENGRRLPYVDSIRLMIQQNRELEMLRFDRGAVHLINNVDPEAFDRLVNRAPLTARDLGPSLESEQLWFNQVPTAPIPAFKREWFRSQEFRRAVSGAINRADICRVVYRGRAVPASGAISIANRFWCNAKLKPPVCDPKAALRELSQAGFHLQAESLTEPPALRDRHGNAVEFSVITNSGNKSRERIATMIQQDLAHIGIRLNVVTLDFPSLIERISRSFRYEACLLGLVNIDLDPNAQMNIWLSSASNHQWNPEQKKPETEWEAEIDRAMLAQAVEVSPRKRKALFDRVQEIAWEQAPFIYLINKNTLAAVSTAVGNMRPAPLHPETFWNIERLFLKQPQRSQ